jgi:hypothetical protein
MVCSLAILETMKGFHPCSDREKLILAYIHFRSGTTFSDESESFLSQISINVMLIERKVTA